MKIFKKIILSCLLFFLIVFSYFFVGTVPVAEKIIWGVNFSQKYTENLGLDWEKTYLALLDDLGVENIKLISHWDLLEPKKGEYYFKDLDWQIETAEQKGAKVLLVIGMKTPRWPECHIPEWAKKLSRKEQQEKILELIENIVLRYRGRNTISIWQVENEPFFPFGECPWMDEDFLKKEAELVKSLDERPILISDSGEGSFWIKAARAGDMVGITMYRKVWVSRIRKYVHYPLPAVFYYRKAKLIETFFGKKVICVELQAEPWGPKLVYDLPFSEQEKTMNLEHFKKNIEFARESGFDQFYLWGVEWMYWMKVKKGQPEIWNEAKKLFNES